MNQFEQPIDFSKHLFRCSSLGVLMTGEKKSELQETTIKELLKIYTEQFFSRENEMSNRFLEKGIKSEGVAIDMISELEDRFYVKNEIRMYNDFITGECDIDDEEESTILDAKSSWDAFSFSKKSYEKYDVKYDWQGVGYLELYKREKFVLFYALINTPQGLIDDECKRFLYEIGTNKKDSQLYADYCKAINQQWVYDDIPLKYRIIKKDPVFFDQSKIDRLYERIVLCRGWLNDYAEKQWCLANGVIQKQPIPTKNIQDEPKLDSVGNSKPIDVGNSKLFVEDSIVELKKPKCKQCNSTALIMDEDGSYDCCDCGYSYVFDITEVSNESELVVKSESEKLDDGGMELVGLLQRVALLSSLQEIVKTFHELKGKFEQYPQLKEFLEKKRDSLKPQGTSTTTKPTQEPKKQPEEPKKQPEEPKKQDIDNLVSIETLRKQFLELKNVTDLRNLYKQHLEFIDSSPEFRDEITIIGIKLSENE